MCWTTVGNLEYPQSSFITKIFLCCTPIVHPLHTHCSLLCCTPIVHYCVAHSLHTHCTPIAHPLHTHCSLLCCTPIVHYCVAHSLHTHCTPIAHPLFTIVLHTHCSLLCCTLIAHPLHTHCTPIVYNSSCCLHFQLLRKCYQRMKRVCQDRSMDQVQSQRHALRSTSSPSLTQRQEWWE